jgi:hypothetical protein
MDVPKARVGARCGSNSVATSTCPPLPPPPRTHPPIRWAQDETTCVLHHHQGGSPHQGSGRLHNKIIERGYRWNTGGRDAALAQCVEQCDALAADGGQGRKGFPQGSMCWRIRVGLRQGEYRLGPRGRATRTQSKQCASHPLMVRPLRHERRIQCQCQGRGVQTVSSERSTRAHVEAHGQGGQCSVPVARRGLGIYVTRQRRIRTTVEWYSGDHAMYRAQRGHWHVARPARSYQPR